MISGCSGGGKSTLLAELARRGHATVAEPGRRIIAQEREAGGNAFPWTDPSVFARRALAMAIADHDAARGLVFFDRGMVDAAVAIEASGGDYPADAIEHYRYNPVFMAPPWPDIYVTDADRRHSLDKALSDYEGVRQAYVDAGYEPVMLPRDTVAARADFVLRTLGRPGR